MRAHLKKDMLTSQQICATNPSLSTWQDALLPTSSLSTYRASHIHWPISLYTTGWAKIMRYFKGMPSLCMSVYIPLCPSVPPSQVLSVTHGPHLKIFFLSFFLLINNIIREENLPPPSSPQINNNNNNYNSRNRSATLTYMKNEDGLETRQWRPERPERPEARLLNLKYQARQVISFFLHA